MAPECPFLPHISAVFLGDSSLLSIIFFSPLDVNFITDICAFCLFCQFLILVPVGFLCHTTKAGLYVT
jgi:hypothetical protein